MIAYVCRTPVQLMRAIQIHLRMKEFCDVADMYLAGVCANDAYKKGLDELNIFEDVYMEPVQYRKGQVVRFMYGNSDYSKTLRKKKYDKLVTFNIEGITSQALYNIHKKNKNFEYHCMEDAPSISPLYTPQKYSWKNYQWWLRIQKECFYITNWWASRPEYMHLPICMSTKLKKLPEIAFDDKELLDIENKVFGFEECEQLATADALIMEESFYTDGNMIDNFDYKIFEEIKKKYPQKKFIVKLHPRTIENRFKNEFEILDAPGIPWELIIFNQGNSSKKDFLLISINCASIVSDLFMFNKEGKKIIMAPYFLDKVSLQNGHPRFTQEDITNLYKVKNLYTQKDNFIIINNKEELFAALNKML